MRITAVLPLASMVVVENPRERQVVIEKAGPYVKIGINGRTTPMTPKGLVANGDRAG